MKTVLGKARRVATGIQMLVLVLATLGTQPGHGSGATGGGRLEDYLELLRYEPAACKPTDTGQLLLNGKLGPKKVVLLVDTGCSLTG